MPLVIFPPRDRIISTWWGKCTVYIFALQHVPRMFENLGALGMFKRQLGGGFKYFSFSPRKLGKIPILTSIFFRWVETTN